MVSGVYQQYIDLWGVMQIHIEIIFINDFHIYRQETEFDISNLNLGPDFEKCSHNYYQY